MVFVSVKFIVIKNDSYKHINSIYYIDERTISPIIVPNRFHPSHKQLKMNKDIIIKKIMHIYVVEYKWLVKLIFQFENACLRLLPKKNPA